MEIVFEKNIIAEVCVGCGKPLMTESNRMICKECEEKAKDEINSKVR
jgi:exosome complex RNA-binding protein Csl4